MGKQATMTEPDRTATWVAAAARGDAAAWKALYGELLPGIWRYVASRIAKRSDVEDVVQEAFLAIVRAVAANTEALGHSHEARNA